MSASVFSLEEIAGQLHAAARTQKPIAQISNQQEITLDQAYLIQSMLLEARYREGEKLIGLKMGFTSEAKMQQMGVNDLIWGRLTDAMLIPNNGTALRNNYIHPRVEPEICFRISKDIPGQLNETEVKQYVDAVCTAIEVIDSRYENFKFSLADVIADNCSSTGFVLGPWVPVPESLNHLSMELTIDEQVVAAGSSNDIMNDPWKSLAAATRLTALHGESIKAGMIVLAGAATNAEFLQQNQHAAAKVSILGSAGFRF